MIRKVFKKLPSNRFHDFLEKYNINTDYFTVNRRSISKAVLVGLFFALLPVPFQLLLVIFITAFIRFNIVLALSIVLLTNPLTMPFVIYAEYKLGTTLMQQDIQVQMQLSMQWVKEHYALILAPLFIGALTAASVLSAVAYFITERLWIHSAKKAYTARKA